MRVLDSSAMYEIKCKEKDERRLCLVQCHSQFLERILKGGFTGTYTSDAPEDLKVVGSYVDQQIPDVLILKCWSKTYFPVMPGCAIPLINITFTEKDNLNAKRI